MGHSFPNASGTTSLVTILPKFFAHHALPVRGQPAALQSVTGRLSCRNLDAIRRTEMHQGNIILDIHEKLCGLHGSDVGYMYLLPPDAASPVRNSA
jgi:hypothetical protein